MVTRGDCGGRDRLDVWDLHVHTPIFKIKCFSMKKKLGNMEKARSYKDKQTKHR